MLNIVSSLIIVFFAFFPLLGSVGNFQTERTDKELPAVNTLDVVKEFTNSQDVEYDSTGIFIYDAI